ncbi:dUTP diphosphatase [Candidatus Berkelbacteria bacterium CG10_big_fil_rev_8_21_14_0_10_41_12]|uniref:dUTP diphosphatase n=1 Tax=Candidatus Berkelbacteria bacterium CG10_big_fil_rev_8_21_14_0_10_41_12 TaxID=1974513 RepID=A0A2M6WY45_9BACT|nr:MAG: dUTP diphosphatase [Candidatus Berkelbacteria bacterium CG10_big_fil_rev_8_21_14_0_10_41_12]
MLINAGIERIVCGSFYGSRYGASEKVVGLAAQAGIQFEFLRSESDQPHGFDEDTIRITEAKVADINKLKVRKIHPSATVPSYSHNGDAGLDLFAVEGATVASGKRASIGTGISVEIPMGYAGLIWDRSGLSQKKGLKTLGGVIDSTYRGEIIVGLYNTSDEAVELMKGDRVAQMLIQPVESAKLEIVEDLSETQRADKGFGSTERSEGKKLEESEIREIKQASVPEEIKTQNKNTRKEENGEGKTKSRW